MFEHIHMNLLHFIEYCVNQLHLNYTFVNTVLARVLIIFNKILHKRRL